MHATNCLPQPPIKNPTVFYIDPKFMSFVTVFVLAFIPNYAASVSFDFTNFTANNIKDELVLLGDVSYNQSAKTLNLIDTNKNTGGRAWQLGRAAYYKRFHLWDKESHDLASFSTNFMFNIITVKDAYNDGLTFFLAEDNSVMYGEGSIGLPFDNRDNTTIHPFVAVEFDTHGNDSWDPYDSVTHTYIGNHVGVNINSTTSAVYAEWSGDISEEGFGDVNIDYHSDSKVLSVSFLNFWTITPSKVELNYTVDLRDVLPEWVIFGFSAAASLDASQMNGVSFWKFNSTKLEGSLDTTQNTTQNSDSPPTTNRQIAKNKTGLVVGLIVGSLVTVTILGIFLYFCWRLKYKYNGDRLEESVRTYSYAELATSTENFADTKKLAPDCSGNFYKGFLNDSNKIVAVKRVYKTSIHGIKQYSAEVKVISQSKHSNLVPLIGWCHEDQKLLLLYEYVENGSLDLHLFKEKSLLSWNTRFIIARDLASALVCLHDELEQCVLHRDIKSSNVMLDSNSKARLGDFGFAKLVNQENNGIAGTVGYIASEYLATGEASKEADVFSFGVVVLEIASGRSAIDIQGHGETNLVKWVWDHYGTEKLLEAADPRLESKFADEEMRCLMMVGLWCAHPDSKHRPSMKRAFQVLNFEATLPQLPLHMPM